MKRVWKCDFCSHTEKDIEKMIIHENKCSFDPNKRNCHSCEFYGDEGYDYSIPYCEKKLNHIEYEEDGNCPEWRTDDIKNLRKIKLDQLNNIK
jgi:hypothetical protein